MPDIFDRIQPDEDVFDRVDSEDSSISRIKTQMMDLLNKFNDNDRKRENAQIAEDLKNLVREEITKIKPVQHVVERHMESQIIKNIPVDRAVPVTIVQPVKEIIKEQPIYKTIEKFKEDKRKLVEEKDFSILVKQSEEMRKQINDFKNEMMKFKEILPMMGGSGVIGIPTPENQKGKTLLSDGVRAYWGTVSAAISTPFSIASFTDGQVAGILIGSGVWKAIGSLPFSASYTNGPATSGFVSSSGLSNLNMTNSFQGPTNNAEAINFPSVGGSILFTLNAAGDNGSDTKSISHTFSNKRYWGVSTVASGFVAGDITGLAGSDIVNSIASTFTVNPGPGQYIIFAAPVRLGIPTFVVNSFVGGFMPPETVSVTNANGYTEDYYVQRSTNSNLGSTTVSTS